MAEHDLARDVVVYIHVQFCRDVCGVQLKWRPLRGIVGTSVGLLQMLEQSGCHDVIRLTLNVGIDHVTYRE